MHEMNEIKNFGIPFWIIKLKKKGDKNEDEEK